VSSSRNEADGLVLEPSSKSEYAEAKLVYPFSVPTRHHGATETTLTDFPGEILLDISEYLPVHDRNSLGRTNQLFYQLLNERLYQRPPASSVAQVIHSNNVLAMQRFLSYGLDLRIRLKVRSSMVPLLSYTVWHEHVEMLRLLLEAGADASEAVVHEDQAVTWVFSETSKLLLECGALLWTNDKGCPLDYLKEYRYPGGINPKWTGETIIWPTPGCGRTDCI
jgi:hypothetical protein